MELTHYTNSMNKLVGILNNGFAWTTRTRDLMHFLVPQHDFSEMDAQQFGMICFSERTPTTCFSDTQNFGSFGITVTNEWAQKHKAQPVVYLDTSGGPFAESFKKVFQIGYDDLKRRIDFPRDKCQTAAFHNKHAAAAVVGAHLWASLLQIYEYLEPSINSSEKEWRLVYPLPNYTHANSRIEDIIENASPPTGWGIHTDVVPIENKDVKRLVCREADKYELIEKLPPDFNSTPIMTV